MNSAPAEKCAAIAKLACDDHEALRLQRIKMNSASSSLDAQTKILSLESTVDSIEAENQKVFREQVQLKNRMGIPTYVYNKIPGFGVTDFSGPSKSAESTSDCRMECDKLPNCMSFSYNKETTRCSWSSNKLEYDDNYVLYIRVNSASAGLGHFQAIAGVKMGVEVQDESTTGLAECKYDCLRSNACSCFSYSKGTQHCVKSQVPLSIGSSWDYYERGHGDSRDKTLPGGEHTVKVIQKRQMMARESIKAKVISFKDTAEGVNEDRQAQRERQSTPQW